jgi:hypothetical protein
MTATDEVIDRALEDVLRRLASLAVAEPAYAVGLAASPGNPSLAIEFVAVATERDRTKWIGEVDSDEAVYLSWNPYEFSIQEPVHVQPGTDDGFLATQAKAQTELSERGIDDPQRHIYNRVAAKIDPARLNFAVTEDFIAFVFDGPDHMETAENMRFSASPQALALLESKDLLLD